jgi:GNAT superfamily N-acetyltransferase
VGYYVVAEKDGQVVGGLMITREWSDWRNGLFLWVQSLYVLPKYRRQGIYRKLYNYVKEMATEEEVPVRGIRLYVDKDNKTAQQVYETMGMEETNYMMFEEEL